MRDYSDEDDAARAPTNRTADAIEWHAICIVIRDADRLWRRHVPMVEMKVVLNASSENLNRTQVLPTPESPIRSNLYK